MHQRSFRKVAALNASDGPPGNGGVNDGSANRLVSESADTCATGQKCEAGKCFWEPAVGEIGDDCTFGQFCLSGLCSNSVFQGDGICTQACVQGIADACPAGLECVGGGAMSVCLPASDEGGCCSTSDQRTPWAPFLLGGIVLGFVVIRRRK